MPLFHRKSDEEKRQEQAERERRAEEASEAELSLQALQAGGIPLQARRRLEELRGKSGALFTSDLSVNEFLLSRAVGARPLSQVMGSSIYHVGWRYIGRTSYGGELSTVTHALNAARILALGRLREEAQLIHADVVVGVHVSRVAYDWAEDVIEFNAVGTAMRLERSAGGELLALTNLSGQDFWKLYENGYWPVGVVGGSSVYHVVPSWGTWRANNTFFGGLWNQELTDFTRGVYAARQSAGGRMHEEAARLSAEGVVGVTVDRKAEEYEVNLGNDQERTDLIVTFQTLGTAIVALRGSRPALPVTQSLNLSS